MRDKSLEKVVGDPMTQGGDDLTWAKGWRSLVVFVPDGTDVVPDDMIRQ